MKFNNESGLVFTDISSEQWREYFYNSETVIRVEKPLMLHVSKSGGHRVFSEDGCSRYIAPGWLQITWKAKDGSPHFVK